MARLAILTKDEIESLYTIPTLDDEERSFLFSLDADDKRYLERLGSTPRKINYILQLGYGRAANYFFKFSFQQQKQDVAFILRHYFPGKPFPKKQISKNYHYDNRTEVMSRLKLVAPDSDFEACLLKEAKSLAKRHALPKFVLQELLDSCLHKKVIKPAYSTLQYMVSEALRYEQQRLTNKLYTAADKPLRAALDTLLDNEDLFYNLTLLKRDQKSFNTTEVKRCVAK